MVKGMKVFFLLASMAVLLLGCKDGDEEKPGYGFLRKYEKAQTIEVRSQSGETVTAMSKRKEIDQFVESLKVDDWELADPPAEAVKGKSFAVYRERTPKFWRSEGKGMRHMTTITAYEDEPYIAMKIKGLHLSFEVPAGVTEYLDGLGGQ